MDIKVRSFLGYAYAARFPKIDELQARFRQVPERYRKPVLKDLVRRGNDNGVRLVLEGSQNNLTGFIGRQRTLLWKYILRKKYINYISEYFRPTPLKTLDYLRAAAASRPGATLDLPKIHLAHLMGIRFWTDLPKALREHPDLFPAPTDPIPQAINSLLRDKNGNYGSMGGVDLCINTERQFIESIDHGKVTLVNHHLLFSDGPEWKVALALRNFVSASDQLFLQGVFYFMMGKENRQRVVDMHVARAVMPGLTWTPNRTYNPQNHRGITVMELARRFPPY